MKKKKGIILSTAIIVIFTVIGSLATVWASYEAHKNNTIQQQSALAKTGEIK